MINRIRALRIRAAHFFEHSRRQIASAGVAVFAIFLSYHVICGANGLVVFQQKRAEYKRLQIELKALEDENKRISDNIRALQTDPKAIEREAREQLRYAKPGEVVYVAPDRPESATRSAQANK